MDPIVTPEFCAAQLRRLLILKGGLPDNLAEYAAALRDIPEATFECAVGYAIRTRQFFPTPAELRLDCDAARPLAEPAPTVAFVDLPGGGRDVTIANPFGGTPLRFKVDRVWRPDCPTCGDTGWAPLQCPAQPCGRPGPHDGHLWVEPCACRPENPTLRRHRMATAKYAKPPAKVA